MVFNLTNYQKQKLKKAWANDKGETIKLNLTQKDETYYEYCERFSPLSKRNMNKISIPEKDKVVQLKLSKREVENLILIALSDDDIKQFVNHLGILNFKDVYLDQSDLSDKIKTNECGIIRVLYRHWICYFKDNNNVYYFDSTGGDIPIKIKKYLNTNKIIYNRRIIQKKNDPPICGHLCLIVLYLLRVKRLKWENVINRDLIHDIKVNLYNLL